MAGGLAEAAQALVRAAWSLQQQPQPAGDSRWLSLAPGPQAPWQSGAPVAWQQGPPAPWQWAMQQGFAHGSQPLLQLLRCSRPLSQPRRRSRLLRPPRPKRADQRWRGESSKQHQVQQRQRGSPGQGRSGSPRSAARPARGLQPGSVWAVSQAEHDEAQQEQREAPGRGQRKAPRAADETARVPAHGTAQGQPSGGYERPPAGGITGAYLLCGVSTGHRTAQTKQHEAAGREQCEAEVSQHGVLWRRRELPGRGQYDSRSSADKLSSGPQLGTERGSAEHGEGSRPPGSTC